MTAEQLELVQKDVVRRREVGDEQIRVVVAERICGHRGMARLVLARETRHRAHDEADAIVVEQGGLSLDRLQRTACQGALGCLLDDGKGKHAIILDPSRAMGRCNVCLARFAERLLLVVGRTLSAR